MPGAITAVPGQVIRSAVWDSIHTDIGNALTQLGQASGNAFINTPRIAAGGSFTVLATDTLVYVTAPAPTISLPAASLMQAPVRLLGAAGTIFGGANSAVVLPAGSDKIDGFGNLTLTANYQSILLCPLSGVGFIIG